MKKLTEILQNIYDGYRKARYSASVEPGQDPAPIQSENRKEGAESLDVIPGPVCSLCKVTPLVVPPTDNPNAAAACINCDRNPKGKW